MVDTLTIDIELYHFLFYPNNANNSSADLGSFDFVYHQIKHRLGLGFFFYSALGHQLIHKYGFILAYAVGLVFYGEVPPWVYVDYGIRG